MNTKDHACEIHARLKDRYPAPAPALDWTDAWELLVATVLAAQCTDERVNKVTPVLFARWPDIASLAEADVTEIEAVVRSTGFFRNKAKNLKAAARRIMEIYGGEVPRTMAELITLGGVARKTANIVLSNAFGVHEGIAVDTHVKRLAFRLGLTANTDPVRIEKDLMPLFPREAWGEINHFLVYFGREVCPARSPRCAACKLDDICPKHGVKK
ncbi:endonuclease III [Pseudodesulfovibrio pelocollis]|uniref:endonuclease III n=1 Tax=Pseudodesulfovibrio pelocollis TaxID=3051432 RepID=UPI00255B3542|nr:endonuclease III [Pseudodesulfovibrio sp. SB368]